MSPPERPSAPASSADPSVATDAPATPSRVGRRGFASAAVLIAVLTALSRLVGFGRTLVLGSVAKPGLSQAYLTANTIPNIIFEIVAGGALAGLVVPMVAGAIARDDRRGVGRDRVGVAHLGAGDPGAAGGAGGRVRASDRRRC